MANYTYMDLLDGELPEEEDRVMLYHKMHTVKKNSKGYYLREEGGNNAWIFNYLGITNKREFCKVSDSDTGLFPHCKSLDHLKNVIEKLWTYTPFEIGDKIKVRKIHNSQDDYAVPTVGPMEGMSDSYITVKKISRNDWGINNTKCNEYGVYLYVESIEGFFWSFDLLDFKDIIKAEEQKTQYSGIPIWAGDYKDAIESQLKNLNTSIRLPVRTRTFEIQL